MQAKLTFLVWTVVNALFLSLQSCTNCSNTDPMPTAPVRFVIVDPQGKNLVSANSSRYNADSVKLLAGNQNFIISRTLDTELGGYVFESYPYNDDSGKSTLQLYFDRTDSDTLSTFYTHIKGDCGSHYEYSKIEHNGVAVGAPSLSGIIRIVK